MEITALGYLGFQTDRLADWETYGRDFLGLQLAERSRTGLAFRMDERRCRLFLHSDAGDGPACFGWEVPDAAALDQLAWRLEAADVPVVAMPSADAEARGVAALIAFEDPAGNRLEAFHGGALASEPFVPGRAIAGFRTGALGLGHVVLSTDDIEQDAAFYRDMLGFRLSDFITTPFRAMFFHVNPRHHSLALIETGRRAIHHVMLEHASLDDVGQAYDLALGEPGRIGTTLGRHTNDFVTSFYATSPSDFLVEIGWGGRTVDPLRWTPVEVTDGPSLWGHDRTWLPPDQRAAARDMRLRAAAAGRRAPVQVLPGHFHLTETPSC